MCATRTCRKQTNDVSASLPVNYCLVIVVADLCSIARDVVIGRGKTGVKISRIAVGTGG